MQMSASGARTWAKMTAAASVKQPRKGRIAIVLDNYVYTAPSVQGEIPNGNSQIRQLRNRRGERPCERVEGRFIASSDTYRGGSDRRSYTWEKLLPTRV
ncbi:MAG: hypothetical protein WDO15_30700 [Bacteroidota bacterium]